ncbi:hypothetical protein E2C01_030225 [Portunus trituberculatus]|uniref:Uncharacterized protein n=1 Tax=Portunus trituberculatus TaxID=210409 RepID=A0A5B7EU66_PORTR|nr:hypothetical protein [Portunus trituberculatus]
MGLINTTSPVQSLKLIGELMPTVQEERGPRKPKLKQQHHQQQTSLTNCSTPELGTVPSELTGPPPPPLPPPPPSLVTISGPPPLLPTFTFHPLPKLPSGPIPAVPEVPPALTSHWCSLEKPWS